MRAFRRCTITHSGACLVWFLVFNTLKVYQTATSQTRQMFAIRRSAHFWFHTSPPGAAPLAGFTRCPYGQRHDRAAPTTAPLRSQDRTSRGHTTSPTRPESPRATAQEPSARSSHTQAPPTSRGWSTHPRRTEQASPARPAAVGAQSPQPRPATPGAPTPPSFKAATHADPAHSRLSLRPAHRGDGVTYKPRLHQGATNPEARTAPGCCLSTHPAPHNDVNQRTRLPGR